MDGDGDTASTNVGTGVAHTGTVTATEDFVESATPDGYSRTGYVSGIAATVEVPDGVVAGEDVDIGFLARGIEVSFLTAAEDIGDGVAGVSGRIDAPCMARLVDIHRDIALGRAVGVVAAVYRAVDGGEASVRGRQGSVGLTDIDDDGAVDLAAVGSIGFTQAAAEGVAVEGAGEDIDGGEVGLCVVHAAEGRAAVDIAVDDRLSGVGVVAEGDGDVAIGAGMGTEAAAEDITPIAVTRGADIGVDVHRYIANHSAVDVGTAVDAGEAAVGGVIVDDHVAKSGSLRGSAGAGTHAAAEDFTIQTVTTNGDGGAVTAAAVDRAEGRAAVEVAIDGAAVERDVDVAACGCAMTEAAAVDDVGGGAVDTHGAAVEGHGDVAAHGALGVAAAVEACGDLAAGHGDGGGAADAGSVAAAEEVGHAARRVVVVVGHRGVAGDGSSIAAAVDVAADDGHVAGVGDVADGHRGIAGDNGRGTLAAAEDVGGGAVLDVHFRMAGGFLRIGSQVTGTVDVA